MREVTKYGKTVEEAVSFALDELNASADQVKIHVLEKPRVGFLGIGVRRALVHVTLKKTPFDFGIEYLENVIEKMNVSANVQVIDRNNRLCHCLFSGRQASELIGRHGRTINALQLLANLVVNEHAAHQMHLLVDAENYREQRKQALIALAGRMADRVGRSGRNYRFPPMPAFERKMIHHALSNHRGVKTFSSGNDPHRCVVITKNKAVQENI